LQNQRNNEVFTVVSLETFFTFLAIVHCLYPIAEP